MGLSAKEALGEGSDERYLNEQPKKRLDSRYHRLWIARCQFARFLGEISLIPWKARPVGCLVSFPTGCATRGSDIFCVEKKKQAGNCPVFSIE